MERESTKHSPRVDDAMAQDVGPLVTGAPVESRTREERVQEDPDVGPGHRGDVPPAAALSDGDLDRRADLARHLASAEFPARREDLVVAARAGNAPDDLVRSLDGLPHEGPFENVQEVWAAMGGPVEPPHTE